MIRKLNCWEYHNCGMEPGGIFADIKKDSCPIPNLLKFDGINDGRGAGRICWMINSNISNPINGQFICRNFNRSCCECAFYKRVHNEEAERKRTAELVTD